MANLGNAPAEFRFFLSYFYVFVVCTGQTNRGTDGQDL